MFAASVFDFNGVLVDDEDVHFEAFREVLRPLGLSVSAEEYLERYLGFDDRGAFHAILEANGRDPTEDQILKLIEAKRPVYLRRAQENLVVFRGARQAVERQARNGPVTIVSGALRPEIELGLSVLGVRDRIEHVVSAEDTRACKPDPEGYLLALDYLRWKLGSIAPARVLVIEDSIAGVQAAKRANLTCVAVTHSYPRPALLDAGADRVYENLDQLTDQTLLTLSQNHA